MVDRVSKLAFALLAAAMLIAPFGCCDVPNLPATLFGPLAPAFCGTPAAPPVAKGVFLDIPYSSPGSTNSDLDVHLPPDGIIPSATILYIHGGGWFSHDKSDATALCALLAARGFAVVNCNYTLSTPEAPGFPQAVYDVKAVVRWIRTIGADFYRLPMKIVAVGDSAGGHLAQMLGTTAGLQRFEPMAPFPGTYRVDAVITFYAPGDLVYHAEHGSDIFATAWFLGGLLSDLLLPRYEEASPITYVNASDPPMAMFHGTADATVPVEVAVRTQEAVAGVCCYCRLYIVSGATHAFDGFGGNEGVAQDIANLIPRMLADPAEPDLNGDGVVDVFDVELFVTLLLDPDAYFAIHAGCNRLQADLNGDGRIDGNDVAFMVRRVLAG